MAKLTGAKKKAFLERMAKGRRKAARGNPKKKAAKRKTTPRAKKPKAAKSRGKKNGKLTGAKKAAFLKRMAAGRRKSQRKPNTSIRKAKKVIGKGFSKPVATEWAREKKRRRKAAAKNPRLQRRGRFNPDDIESAAAMYEEFHQKAPGHIVEYEQMVEFPGNLAELGKLIELRFYLDSANPKFPLTKFGDCQVLATADGSNIYFNGGDQSVDYEALDIASDKDMIELGPCSYICYHTTKGFHDFAPTDYWHHFGEEDGIFPRLAYDRLNRTLFLLGGNYQVKREGITN